jgi:glutathione S-transferase
MSGGNDVDLHLISHVLCPYVQRAAIVLAEQDMPFRRTDIDLSAKPDWFLALSPLAKTPVLIVDGEAIFESAVIVEYLDETGSISLHPDTAIDRARHRGWIEVASAILSDIAGLYSAATQGSAHERQSLIRKRFLAVEKALGDGPYFRGAAFCLVDAAFAPVFRYFDAFAAMGMDDALEGLTKVALWRAALAMRPSVKAAVVPDFPARLDRFLMARTGYVGVLARAPRP